METVDTLMDYVEKYLMVRSVVCVCRSVSGDCGNTDGLCREVPDGA